MSAYTRFLVPYNEYGNIQLSPASERLNKEGEFTVTSASPVTKTVETLSYLEVHTDQDLFIKYGTNATIDATNFDEIVTNDVTRAFVIPQGFTQIQLLARDSDCTVILINKK